MGNKKALLKIEIDVTKFVESVTFKKDFEFEIYLGKQVSLTKKERELYEHYMDSILAIVNTGFLRGLTRTIEKEGLN